MRYRQLGKTGLTVSELCLGTMTFARECDEVLSVELLDRFIAAGGNFIDTADVYSEGRSEEIIGRALQGRRHDFVVATKVRFRTGPQANDAGLSRRHIIAGCEASLRRLQTDYIDLYQGHCWDPYTPLEETLAAFDDLVHSGKVRYIGVSNFAAWQLMKASVDQRAARLGAVRLLAAALQPGRPRDRAGAVAALPGRGSGRDPVESAGRRLPLGQVSSRRRDAR